MLKEHVTVYSVWEVTKELSHLLNSMSLHYLSLEQSQDTWGNKKKKKE